MKQHRKLLTVLLLTALIPILPAGAVQETSIAPNSGIQTTSISNTLSSINALYQYLNANFLWDIDISEVEEELTKGLMAALNDPYSEYITADEKDEFDESTTGLYVGIGTYLTKYNPENIDWDDPETYMVQITAPFPGGPADRAGLRAHDLISHINGESVYDLTATEASRKMRGQEGEELTLTVHRGSAVFDVTLKPEKVTTPNVSSEIISGTDIGYLSIVNFSESTYSLVSSEMTKLTSDGIKGLVIDLRNNTGGVVNASILVSNFFLESGDRIVSTKYKDGSGRQNRTTVASNETRKYLDLPLVILVNGGTASASEIMTAALQENGRALIIGTKTFGKGIMQDVINWKDGYIKYTSAHYLTPNGNDIHEIGITPDIIIEESDYTDEEIESYFDFLDTHTDELEEYIEENPDYTVDNIEAYAEKHSDSSVPPILLKLLARNQYIYSMDYDKRPLTDPVYDTAMKTAVEYLESL